MVKNTKYTKYDSTSEVGLCKGTLYIISAPSGAGKSSLIQALLKTNSIHNTQIIQVSVSYTTRAMRIGETQGQHYFFISVAEFEHMIAENAFLEYAQVFGNYYGTSRANIEQILSVGIDVFLDIDWQGAQQVRCKIPDTYSIFILPPSKEELNRRLRERRQDSEEIINQRMDQMITEITHFIEYDYLIINDDFNTALFDLKAIILSQQLRINRQKLRHDILISKLLAD